MESLTLIPPEDELQGACLLRRRIRRCQGFVDLVGSCRAREKNLRDTDGQKRPTQPAHTHQTPRTLSRKGSTFCVAETQAPHLAAVVNVHVFTHGLPVTRAAMATVYVVDGFSGSCAISPTVLR